MPVAISYGPSKRTKKPSNSIHDRPKWNQNQPKKRTPETSDDTPGHCGACSVTRYRKQTVAEILEQGTVRKQQVANHISTRFRKIRSSSPPLSKIATNDRILYQETQMEVIAERDEDINIPRLELTPGSTSGCGTLREWISPATERDLESITDSKNPIISVKCTARSIHSGEETPYYSSVSQGALPFTNTELSSDADGIPFDRYPSSVVTHSMHTPAPLPQSEPVISQCEMYRDDISLPPNLDIYFKPIHPPQNSPERPATVTNPLQPDEKYGFITASQRRYSVDEPLTENYSKRFKPYSMPHRRCSSLVSPDVSSRYCPEMQHENDFLNLLNSLSSPSTYNRVPSENSCRLTVPQPIAHGQIGLLNNTGNIKINKESCDTSPVLDLHTVPEEDEEVSPPQTTDSHNKHHSRSRSFCTSRSSLRDAFKNLTLRKPKASDCNKTENVSESKESKTVKRTKKISDSKKKKSDTSRMICTRNNKVNSNQSKEIKDFSKQAKQNGKTSTKSKSLNEPCAKFGDITSVSALSVHSSSTFTDVTTDRKPPLKTEKKPGRGSNNLHNGNMSKAALTSQSKWKFNPMILIYGNKEKKQKAVMKKKKTVKKQPKTRPSPSSGSTTSTALTSSADGCRSNNKDPSYARPVRRPKTKSNEISDSLKPSSTTQTETKSAKSNKHAVPKSDVMGEESNKSVKSKFGISTRPAPYVAHLIPPRSAVLKTHSKPVDEPKDNVKQSLHTNAEKNFKTAKLGGYLGPSTPWTNIFGNMDVAWTQDPQSRYAITECARFPAPQRYFQHSRYPTHKFPNGYMSDTPHSSRNPPNGFPKPTPMTDDECYYKDQRPLTRLQMMFACRPREESYAPPDRSPEAPRRVVRFKANPTTINGERNIPQFHNDDASNRYHMQPKPSKFLYQTPNHNHHASVRAEDRYISFENKINQGRDIRFSLRNKRIKANEYSENYYPPYATMASRTDAGQPRMPNFHNGDAMYDRPNGGPYASYTTNGARGMRSTYPPTGRGGFGKGNLSKQFRPMTFGTAPRSDYSHTTHPDNSPMKPKVVTVVRAGQIRPHKKITILLNRRSVQTFEQLVADISEALGQPKWKNDHIRKLYTLKGREVKSVSDFFREDDVFIAVGKEQLTTMDVQEVLEELYPDSPYAQNLIRQNLEKAYKNKGARRQPFTIAEGTKGSKSDSGLGDSTEGDRRFNDVGTNKSPRDKARGRHLLNERRKFQEEDRQRAKKWERERMEREQEELEEELRRRGRGRGRVGGASNGIAPASDVEVKTSIRDAERRRKERQQWEAEERERQHRKQREEDEKRRRQLDDNKREREKLQREKEEEERRRLNAEEDARRKREEAEQEKRRRKAEDEERERRRREADKLRKEEEARIKREEEERRIREEDAEREREKRRKEEEARRRREEEEEERRKREEERRNRDRERERERERKREREEREREEELRRREEENSTRSTPQRKQPFHKVDDTDRSRKVQKYKAPSRGMITRSDIETRYEIGKTIGDGNFAIVKESRLRNTEAEYAMKIIDKSKLKGKEDMIENEIAIMKNCIHPNIVRLVEEFETEDEIYLMLEYVKGGDLFDAITESVKFTERDAANMVADLCEALAFLHDKNIVHRDLKPENLLVSRNKDGSMTLKLADFGLAMEVTEPIYTVCGTPTYVAPEILAETGYGLEVDMWATGVITYILLCGFPPFRSHDRNQEELFEIIQLGEYEFLSPYWDSISDAAKDLIFKLLVVDTKRRYTAEQVLQHPWIKSEGSCKKINLQREITMNLERNFGADRSRRKAGLAGAT
ncbi:uncharacterized protein LOC120342771 isoform X1 [Styela clava]